MLLLSNPTAVLIPFLMQQEIYFYPWSAHSAGIHYWLSVGIKCFPFCFERAAKAKQKIIAPSSFKSSLITPLYYNADTNACCWLRSQLTSVLLQLCVVSISSPFPKPFVPSGLNLWWKPSATKSVFWTGKEWKIDTLHIVLGSPSLGKFNNGSSSKGSPQNLKGFLSGDLSLLHSHYI